MQPNPNPSGEVMLERGERIKDKVHEILEKYPQTRGDDLQLYYRYCQRFEKIKIKFDDFKALLFAPAPETVSRRRRELQQEYPDLRPSERVKSKRRRAQMAYREHYRQESIITYAGMEG